MYPAYLTKEKLHEFIRNAMKEDHGDGDHTSLGSIPVGTQVHAHLLFKQEGIVAGMEMAQIIFDMFSKDLLFESYKKDGDAIHAGEVGFKVSGDAIQLLGAERLVLNCMQRMSGIATYTHYLKSLIRNSHAQLLDTRKTTPNFRIAEKWAVEIGGGTNHRFGLYDMVMLKDNHIDFAGGVAKALKSTKSYLKKSKKKLKIEIEVRSLQELREVIGEGGVDRIMLDNMMPSQMRQGIAMIAGKYETEASGGITEMSISEIADTGVDYISVGALTHSYKSLDMSLKAI
ncbi:carboxylating nicotinate-nucleotide diphosphorylase [Cyclobacteriaceae bacterium]|jgi:nicotinate-nucleotide pyrophosphorylase (carboxylating)|nr:carboxylating nicotinate-nucleotide diphosphorylase [Cyclobacteriaceae bacterium]MDB4315098.1 carboxylating nicotinate-nucleotide diphosphorylase [Cyclobacteriaceae bacterium]MDB4741840.1 carboxylating nicotinate-nucleotide diphosphorylase [Cyclobacteriaceae bacterium]MDC1368998.1 carboxylating nicotinate-nucleotide diphosphorylase [Cyclobacteriaceae bacterium]MDC6484298.1 carboxylating nicotinate-nucleotide diphosphorylase [Cyclobacteriaceae bacterium]